MGTVVIVTGGEPAPLLETGSLDDSSHLGDSLVGDSYVIAADSGLVTARMLGLRVDLLIGDLDSVPQEELDRHPGLEIDAHSPDKDKTDLELSLDAARARRPDTIVILGGTGGRIDHLLANAALLASPSHRGPAIKWLTGEAAVHAVHTSLELKGSFGDLVSLLPYGGPAQGVTTTGLRWALRSATIPPGSTWGMSNEMSAPTATVTVAQGVLLVIHTPARRSLSPA
jgi:thiamine pyrophosphokinase